MYLFIRALLGGSFIYLNFLYPATNYVYLQISQEVSDVLNKALCNVEPTLTNMESAHPRYVCFVATYKVFDCIHSSIYVEFAVTLSCAKWLVTVMLVLVSYTIKALCLLQ